MGAKQERRVISDVQTAAPDGKTNMEADLILHAFDENLLERVIFSDLQFSSNYEQATKNKDLPINDQFSELSVHQTKSKSDSSV